MGQESYKSTQAQEDFQILNAEVKRAQGALLGKWFDGDDAQVMTWLTQSGNPELLRSVVTKYLENHRGEVVNIDELIAEVKSKSASVEGEVTLH